MTPNVCPRCHQRDTLRVLHTLYGDYVWCMFGQDRANKWCAWFGAVA